MSERMTLVAEKRNSSKEKAKRLRQGGWIPAVIYGQGTNTSIKLQTNLLQKALRETGTTSLIDILVGEQNLTVLAKDVQRHLTRGDLIHVDFYEVNMQETIIVEAALVTTGVSAPVEEGLGTTSLVLHAVEVECLPGNLISEIEVDLSLIETPEDSITVGDLKVPAGVTIVTDLDALVANFEYLTAEEVEEEEEEELLFAQTADDVEVIGRAKQDEDVDQE